jgi:hypothetical protein
MSSEVKVDKVSPRGSASSYIELGDSKVTIYPKLLVDNIESLTGILTISSIAFTTILADDAVNDTIFIDSADGVLKFKDSTGTLHALY